MNVALMEAGKLGGTCLHRGCIPTKALLHAAEVAESAKESEAYGVKASFDGIDMVRVNEYRDGVVARLYKGLQGLVKSRNVTYIEGYGKLVAPNTIEVNGQRVTGKNVLLATGSYSRSLPGLDIGGRVITSDEALNLDYVPNSVIVLGGGVIGDLTGFAAAIARRGVALVPESVRTIGMRGAYSAMRDGHVDETWAREHHELWYNDIKAGKIPAQRSQSAEPAAKPVTSSH